MSLPSTPGWSLTHLGLKFPAAAVAAGAIYLTLAEDPTPMVAITFDDGRLSTYTEALPYMDTKGIVGTTYITTNLLGDISYINEDQLRQFVSSEWEIGAHGNEHLDFTTLDEKTLEENLVGPIRNLAEISGQEIFSVASPYGSYNDQTIEAIQKTYYSHVGAVHGGNVSAGINLPDSFDPFRVNRIDITSDVTIEDVCLQVASLPEDSLFVILFHNITDEPGLYNTTPVTFKSIIDCVADADVNVVRISDAVEAMVRK